MKTTRLKKNSVRQFDVIRRKVCCYSVTFSFHYFHIKKNTFSLLVFTVLDERFALCIPHVYNLYIYTI